MVRILPSGVEGCEKQIRVDQGDIKGYRKGCSGFTKGDSTRSAVVFLLLHFTQGIHLYSPHYGQSISSHLGYLTVK